MGAGLKHSFRSSPQHVSCSQLSRQRRRTEFCACQREVALDLAREVASEAFSRPRPIAAVGVGPSLPRLPIRAHTSWLLSGWRTN